jgi:hypothetical protein
MTTAAISKKTVTVLMFGMMTTVFIQDDDDCNLQKDGVGIGIWDNDGSIYSGQQQWLC